MMISGANLANHPRPRVINVDGNPAYPSAIHELKRTRELGRRCRCRPVRYLNNVVEMVQSQMTNSAGCAERSYLSWSRLALCCRRAQSDVASAESLLPGGSDATSVERTPDQTAGTGRTAPVGPGLPGGAGLDRGGGRGRLGARRRASQTSAEGGSR